MFPYYLLPGNKPKSKPKPRKPSSYLPSYLTVYVKPDPKPAQAGIPDDILPFVNPNPKPVSQPKRRQYDPLSSIQVRKRESGNKRSSSSRVSQSERTVRIRTGQNPGPREIIPDKSLRDIADVPVSGVDPADLKFYFAARDHDLVRSVEAALTHEGLPARYETEPATYPRDYFAEYGMDAEADAAAEAYTRKYAEEMGLQRAQEVTREVIEDLSNDEMESVVAVDRDTGEIIFVRYGDEDSVTLQEEQRKLVAGRNIVLIHNHWNNSAASMADLGAADWLDAERLVVVTPSGERYYYHRRGGKLVALKPIQGPGVVAESDPVETAVARLLHMMQSAREAGHPAERVMEKGDEWSQAVGRIHIPAGMTAEQARQVFYDDVAENRINRANTGNFILFSYEQAWGNRWKEDPESWYDYGAIDAVMPIIKDVAQRWNHPALGMSDDEVVALLTANLHREAYYRRKHLIVIGMPIGDIIRNFGDIVYNSAKDQHSGASVGPANLRVKVADEILGALKIPMPEGGPADFYDMSQLDELERKWQNLDEGGRKELLYDDEIAITLMAANLYRGAERLYQQYLKQEGLLEGYRQNQSLLEQHRQERGFSDEFIEQQVLQQQHLEQYLQQDEYRASMFNMSTWLSQGIAESNDLRAGIGEASAAIDHARETLPFISAILENEAFGLTASEDGFTMFNEDDFHAYLRD